MAEKLSLWERAILAFRKKKVVHEKLDPDSVKENVAIGNLAKENAELKGILARIESEKGEERESERDKQEEDEIKIALDQRQKEITNKEQVQYFSLKTFFQKYFTDAKFRDNLNYLTWNRKGILAPFEDFGLSSDKNFVAIGREGGKRKIILKTKTLPDMFQSVEAIENDILRGMIPLNLDEEGDYVENLQVTPISEIVPNGEGQFYYSKAKKKPLYEYVKDLNDQISELSGQVEEAETTNIKLQGTNDELARANRLLQKGYSVQRKNLSQNEQEFTSMNTIFNETAKELTQTRLLNTSLEEIKESLEDVADELRAKAEREGTKLADEKSYEKIGKVINQMQNIMILGASQQQSPPKEEKKDQQGGEFDSPN